MRLYVDREKKWIADLADIRDGVGDDYAEQLETMTSYRRLPIKVRTAATYRFRESPENGGQGRDPNMEFSESDLLELIGPEYAEYTQEEKKFARDQLKLNDLLKLLDYAEDVKIDTEPY
mgnify:CR=1 FL=1